MEGTESVWTDLVKLDSFSQTQSNISRKKEKLFLKQKKKMFKFGMDVLKEIT
jgi:hypothetical protein